MLNLKPVNTINDVIIVLDSIIAESEKTNNPLGYFAVLYRKVTIKVKEGIETFYFENAERMEKLDIVFAKRYIDAYYAWQQNEAVSQSWKIAFELAENKKILVFQHFLLGMHAHINFDLGIAAAEISTKDNIYNLKNDFDKINRILSSLVDEVQAGLTAIWPPLKKVLLKLNKTDNYIVDFSMEVARDGAWHFATTIFKYNNDDWPKQFQIRDFKVAEKSKIITNPGQWAQIIFWFIRLGERGTVAEKMNKIK
jgi:hypothetical protein